MRRLELALSIIDKILRDLEGELSILRQEVFENKSTNRTWEKSLQKFDECLIKIYQTKYIKKALESR